MDATVTGTKTVRNEAGATVTRPRRPGGVVRARRLERGLSQVALGNAAGLHPSTIGLIERGVATTPETLEKIAGALGVAPEELRA